MILSSNETNEVKKRDIKGKEKGWVTILGGIFILRKADVLGLLVLLITVSIWQYIYIPIILRSFYNYWRMQERFTSSLDINQGEVKVEEQPASDPNNSGRWTD